MKITLSDSDPVNHRCAALVVGCFEGEIKDNTFIAKADEMLDGSLLEILETDEFTGKSNAVKIIHSLGKLAVDRLVLVGIGKRGESTKEKLREAAGTALQTLRRENVTRFASILHQAEAGGGEAIRAVTEGFILAGYEFTDYKTGEREKKEVEAIEFLCQTGIIEDDESALREGLVAGECTIFVRDLVSHPGNIATPSYLGDIARKMAEGTGITCSILGRDEMKAQGMGAILAVARGSRQEPQFIILEYRGANTEVRPLALIGKGVTFDSGGISLKPREGMERMKDDMAGAAAVLGTIKAVSAMRLPINLVCLIPAAENLPDGDATKPGDIIKTMQGKTVEITNTDAEGRLLLCDALHFAKQYNPEVVIDIATLTGACVIALGHVVTGVMGNDDLLIKALKKAGERSGERLWQLPLYEEYGELMKSDVADLKNAGGATAGAISAGWFLKQFVGDTRWAHLDIAGTAWEEKGIPYVPKGASGVGVRLLLEYLKTCSGER